jgi:hypothetical protein
MGLFKKVGNFFGDVGKGIAKNAIAPLESVTGRDWNPGYRTKAGRAIAVAADKGTNMLHVAPKAFADGFTGGRATKWANNLREKKYREKPFKYNEMNMQGSHNSTGVKTLDKGFNILGKGTAAGAGVFGQVYAIAGAAKTGKKLLGPTTEQKTKTGSQVLGVVAGLAVAFLIKR